MNHFKIFCGQKKIFKKPTDQEPVETRFYLFLFKTGKGKRRLVKKISTNRFPLFIEGIRKGAPEMAQAIQGKNFSVHNGWKPSEKKPEKLKRGYALSKEDFSSVKMEIEFLPKIYEGVCPQKNKKK